MNVEKSALALRRIMLRTARSRLAPLWAGLYEAVARLVALVVAPRRTRASVYVSGSLAAGEAVYGVSDIDLVAVASDEGEARRVRRRFEALCRAVRPLRELIPEFWVYDARGLARLLAGPYQVNGSREGRAVFLGADALSDEMKLLERPGLYGEPEWRRVRGTLDVARPPGADNHLLASWLQLQYRWRWALYACGAREGVHRPALGAVADAARIWLWLAHGERHDTRRAALERAIDLRPEDREGLLHALEIDRSLHRSPAVALEKLLPCFVGLSNSIAGLVDEAALVTGGTRAELLGARDGDAAAEGVPLLDWRALVLSVIDWSDPNLPWVVEERLVATDGDPTDPASLMTAAARDGNGRVPGLHNGSLLIEPTSDVWGRGRLRTVQCRASDPVSAALLDGRAHADFPDVPGWSARDCGRRAVAEHRAWLSAGRGGVMSRHGWLATRPPAEVSTTPGTVGLLFSAARAALFLESVEQGDGRLALTFADTVDALAARDPGVGADAAETWAALEERRDEPRPLPAEVVERFRRQVRALPGYAPPRPPAASITVPASPAGPDGRAFAIRRGANVSHWLSQTWWMTEEERSRRFSADDALRIRELGLDHVRLPVEEDWLWHADGRRDTRVFELLWKTLEWCRAAELAVVVDLHRLVARRGITEDVPQRWGDLSEALAAAPLDAVAYELLGEPKAPRDEQWNDDAAASIAAIREREPERTIVLGSNRENGYGALPALAVPDDPHLILTFHYYQPTLLTHYRASWLPVHGAYHGPIRYPGQPIPPAELARVERKTRAALERGNRHFDAGRIREDLEAPLSVGQRTGLPLYCGEFGAATTVPDPLRLRWYRDVIEAFEEQGIAWATWDLKGHFGLFDADRPTVAHRAIGERGFAS